MNLEQIKNEYAVSKGFENWNNLLDFLSLEFDTTNYHINRVIIIAQKECLKSASENVICSRVDTLVKESITNENNIIK